MLWWHILEHVSTLQHSSVPLSPAMAVCAAIDANVPAEIQPLLLIVVKVSSPFLDMFTVKNRDN